MPLSLDGLDHVVRVRALGVVGCSEVLDVARTLLRQPAVYACRPILVDARGVTRAPSTRELHRIAAEILPFAAAGIGPIGILTENICIYGIARMFSVLAESAAHISAFRNFHEAAQWLECQSRPGDARPASEVLEALLESGTIEARG